VGFEPTILAFERAKTVHALDRAASVIGIASLYNPIMVPQHALSDLWEVINFWEEFRWSKWQSDTS
jgi:hypothetical protein